MQVLDTYFFSSTVDITFASLSKKKLTPTPNLGSRDFGLRTQQFDDYLLTKPFLCIGNSKKSHDKFVKLKSYIPDIKI